MKNKFTDKDLMQFADKQTTGERAMDILSALLKGDEESKILAKRLAVFTAVSYTHLTLPTKA